MSDKKRDEYIAELKTAMSQSIIPIITKYENDPDFQPGIVADAAVDAAHFMITGVISAAKLHKHFETDEDKTIVSLTGGNVMVEARYVPDETESADKSRSEPKTEDMKKATRELAKKVMVKKLDDTLKKLGIDKETRIKAHNLIAGNLLKFSKDPTTNNKDAMKKAIDATMRELKELIPDLRNKIEPRDEAPEPRDEAPEPRIDGIADDDAVELLTDLRVMLKENIDGVKGQLSMSNLLSHAVYHELDPNISEDNLSGLINVSMSEKSVIVTLDRKTFEAEEKNIAAKMLHLFTELWAELHEDFDKQDSREALKLGTAALMTVAHSYDIEPSDPESNKIVAAKSKKYILTLERNDG